jgi:hypothetical protein
MSTSELVSAAPSANTRSSSIRRQPRGGQEIDLTPAQGDAARRSECARLGSRAFGSPFRDSHNTGGRIRFAIRPANRNFLGIAEGELVSPENIVKRGPDCKELSENLYTPPPNYIPEAQRANFLGFRRSDGALERETTF